MIKTRGFNRNRNPPPRNPVGDHALPENVREPPKKTQQRPIKPLKPVNNVRQNLAVEQTKNKKKIVTENLDEEEDQNQQIPVNNVRHNLNRDATQYQNLNMVGDLDQDVDQDLD